MLEQLQVQIINNSGEEKRICLYQPQPTHSLGMVSLAFGSILLQNSMSTLIEFVPKLYIAYSADFTLPYGSVFEPISIKEVDTFGSIVETFCQNGFSPDTSSVSHETISYPAIAVCEELPENSYSIGYGISLSDEFNGNKIGLISAWGVQPDTSYGFMPETAVWITYGDFQNGEVLNESEIVLTSAQLIITPDLKCTATLGPNNDWVVTP